MQYNDMSFAGTDGMGYERGPTTAKLIAVSNELGKKINFEYYPDEAKKDLIRFASFEDKRIEYEYMRQEGTVQSTITNTPSNLNRAMALLLRCYWKQILIGLKPIQISCRMVQFLLNLYQKVYQMK